MERCAIIGSKSYIGSHIQWYLKKIGINPNCYDVSNSVEDNYVQIDLTDKESLKKIILDVDYIFMISGVTGTFTGFDNFEKYITINEIGLINLLDLICCCRKFRRKKRKLMSKAINSTKQDLDVINILQKLHEIDKIK